MPTQGVKNVSFSENFAQEINERSLKEEATQVIRYIEARIIKVKNV